MKHYLSSNNRIHLGQRLRLSLVVPLFLVGALLFVTSQSAQANVDVGYKDFSYSGVTAPTGQKPQSKLWYNDGIWWGCLFNTTTRRYEIYRLDWASQQWNTTGTPIDARTRSSADALWDGTHLYLVSAVSPGSTGDLGIKVYRYSYNSTTKTYTIDSGFPVTVTSRAVETVVMDRDSQGVLWLTYTYGSTTRSVYVSHTTTNDLTWVTPYVLPVTGADNLNSDDISTLVSYNNKIGVMWSNQTDHTVYFAYHNDTDPDNVWTLNPALQGPGYADDHINIKSLQADPSGQLFAAVKTSLNDGGGGANSPLILVLTLDNHGAWQRRTFGTVADDHTRPIILLDVENRQIYVFATVPVGSTTSGAIYYKSVSLDDGGMQFPPGLGTPFMSFASDTHINNASSTKQMLTSTTDLVVIAGDDTSRYYFHNIINLGPSGPTPTPTATALPSSTPTATATPTPTATYTPTPNFTPTNTATPTNTSTPGPSATPTETPLPTNTPLPSSTPTDTPTATPIPPFLFSDGFESGNFASWTSVRTGGGGQAFVQSSIVRNGVYAAELSSTSTAGSFAYARATLASSQVELTVSGYFQILTEGAGGANIPIFRLYDPAGVRLLTLYRQNLSGNTVWIGHSGSNYQTTGLLPLNTWAYFSIHVITAGSGASTIEVYKDGNLIYQTATASLGSTGVLTIQIGNDTKKQIFRLVADDILVTAAGLPGPTPTPTATLPPSSTPTATATSTPSNTPTITPLPTDTATPGPSATPTDTPLPTNTPLPSPTPTETPLPSATPTPTHTATPTDTPLPTNTPLPSPTPTDTPTATPIPPFLFSDGFESGNFASWTSVQTGGEGQAFVQSSIVRNGVYAAELSSTSTTGSFAYARATLASSQVELTVSGYFQILTEGLSGANVPIFRLYDQAGTRLLTLYRQNLSGDTVWVGHSGSHYRTTGLLPLNTWAYFSIHVITAGSGASTIAVYMNDNLIYQTTTASLGSTGVLTIQIGNDTSKQIFRLVADDILVTP